MCIDLLDDQPLKEEPLLTSAKRYVEEHKLLYEVKEDRRDTTVTHAVDSPDYQKEYGKIEINTFGNESKPIFDPSTFRVLPRTEGKFFRIYVNDILHVAFEKEKLKGFQSWKEGEIVHKYCIELLLENSPLLLLEYDLPEKWKEVIRVLNTYGFQ